jgi:hypothetical protein
MTFKEITLTFKMSSTSNILGGTKKYHENYSSIAYADRYSNSRPFEYEAGVIISQWFAPHTS